MDNDKLSYKINIESKRYVKTLNTVESTTEPRQKNTHHRLSETKH